MKNALIAATLTALVVSACAPKPRLKLGKTSQGEVVEAEGVVPLHRNDIPGTEAAALAAAQRAAVEKVVGVYVSGKTVVEKATLIESKILARTEGYISRYDLISKGPDGDSYRTRIRALVLFKQIGEDLKAAGLLDVGDVGNPRVAVLLEETVDGQPAESVDGARGLAQSLLTRGYTVVDRSAIAGAVTQGILEAVNKGDFKKVADLGSTIGAEVVVTGTDGASQIKDTDNRLGGLISYRARASVQAVRSGSGQVLATASHDASGLDATKGLASSKALASAAGLAGEELAGTLFAALQTGAETIVVVRGVRDLDKLQHFQEELRTMTSGGKIVLRSFDAQTAELSVVGASKSGGDLAAIIARMKSVSAEVDTYSAARVEASIKE